MSEIRGNKTLAGTHGELWINGQKIAEFSKVEIKISANREDVQMGMSVDSKLVGLKGEITVTVKKVYSRATAIIESWRKGNDPRAQVITALNDPDAVGGQQERYSVDNVWWNDLTPVSMERGKTIEEEMTGGFTPEDLVCLDRISA